MGNKATRPSSASGRGKREAGAKGASPLSGPVRGVLASMPGSAKSPQEAPAQGEVQDGTVGGFSLSDVSQLHCFSIQELKDATGNFSELNCIGEGGFGKVYRGMLREREEGKAGGRAVGRSASGLPIAVKRLHTETGATPNDEWLVEILVLSKLRHPSLIRLLGYCLHKGTRMLVYDLCKNGSLEDRIFATSPEQVLDWDMRLNLVAGTARGLAYLHEQRIIHRDLKPGNILLDDEMNPKVCDFGMAKESPVGRSHVTTRVMGTLGYLDPEYMESGYLREGSDVFAFGVILLQLLTGLPATDSDQKKLVNRMEPHLIPQVTEPFNWIDPLLSGQYPRESALQLAAIARRCIAPSVQLRPSMKDVVQAMDLVIDMKKSRKQHL